MSIKETLLQREAASKAIEWVFRMMRQVGDKRIEHVDGRLYAIETYPLPVVIQPRTMRVDDYEWKVVDGTLWCRHVDGGDWERAHTQCAATAERVAAWHDLYQRPNEEVEVTS